MNKWLGLLVLIPSLASASEPAGDNAPFADDLRLTAMLQHDVESVDGRRIGEVRDFVIDVDATFQAVIVEFDTGADASATARMEWSDARLNPREGAVVVGVGRQDVAATDEAVAPAMTPGLEASRLIGMPVHLDDVRSFGRVVDVLVDPVMRQPSALVVMTAGANPRRYALPIAQSGIRPDEGHVTYAGSREEVEARGEFPSRQGGAE